MISPKVTQADLVVPGLVVRSKKDRSKTADGKRSTRPMHFSRGDGKDMDIIVRQVNKKPRRVGAQTDETVDFRSDKA